MKRCGVNLEVRKFDLKLESFLLHTGNFHNLWKFPEGCQNRPQLVDDFKDGQNYPQLGDDFKGCQNYPQLGDDFRYAVIQPDLC